MKTHGLVFCPEMIQALLEGRKTMTRRLIVSQIIEPDCRVRLNDAPGEWKPSFGPLEDGRLQWFQSERLDPYLLRCFSPYAVGDLVYAKETVYVSPMYPFPVQYIRPTPKGQRLPPGWRVYTSRFMPKKCARLWFRIAEVHPPERVQIISYDDIVREGYLELGRDIELVAARAWWQALWTRLHGPESWQQNPWVWVLRLERIETP